jgi:hypothetical protein
MLRGRAGSKTQIKAEGAGVRLSRAMRAVCHTRRNHRATGLSWPFYLRSSAVTGIS